MGPLVWSLALLAMAMATTVIEVNMDMAWNSFDDQYLKCSDKMSEKFPELQDSDFYKNDRFAKNWTKATAEWQKQGSVSYSLSPDQAIALMAYTMKHMKLYEEFNVAVREAGSSSWEYQNKFQFKSLHFLLTQALQKLKPDKCQYVYRGVTGVKFKAVAGKEVRFGQFTSTSRSEKVAQDYGKDTVFKVYTCHGVDIQNFSYSKSEQEVLIPPFETFKVTKANPEDKQIELSSTRNFSNYECEWLKGGSLLRNSPHLRGLLLATVAIAVATGTL